MMGMKTNLLPKLCARFASEGISLVTAVPFEACRVTDPRKLTRLGIDCGDIASVLIFAVPYHTGEVCGNLSVYAAPRDYHFYFRALFDALIPDLRTMLGGRIFAGFADSSPIDERHCAALGGLGILGDNGLLITEDYGSYVFLGEILTDVPIRAFYEEGAYDASRFSAPIGECLHCGACRRACPSVTNSIGITRCLSEVTQTKHLAALCTGADADKCEADFIRYIRQYGSAWGCDRCQTSCPLNAQVLPTDIPFFRHDRIPSLTVQTLSSMTDDEFSTRAYAWRKRGCIMRNLELLEHPADGIPDKDLRDAIVQTVREAAAVMYRAHDVESREGAIDEKAGPANFVTVYDVRVQNLLMEALHGLLPDAKFFAEEKENDPAILREGYTFIIDPIDGTTNFIHNWGMSAISVGLLYAGTPVYGVICDPYRDELYEAVRGGGAFCNGRPIHVSDRPADKGVYAVGTAPYYRETLGDRTFAMMRHLYEAGVDIRRLGSAALDLAAVACGRADGYIELLISQWDYAAGALLVEEAGGIVTDPCGEPMQYAAPSGICAGTPKTHALLLDACRS